MKLAEKIFESYKGSLLETSINNNTLSGLLLCRYSAINAIRRQKNNPVKLHFLKTSLEHIESRISLIQRQTWVKSLVNYSPKKNGHWGNYTTGFNISLNGKIWLSDNEEINIKEGGREGILQPNHKNLVTGESTSKTIYSGLYTFIPNEKPSLYLYSECETVLNHSMKVALLSLVGVHNITRDTVVYSNMNRSKLFSLGDI